MTDVSVRAEGAEKEAIRTNFPYFYLIIVNTQNFPPRLATAETESYATKQSYEICFKYAQKETRTLQRH